MAIFIKLKIYNRSKKEEFFLTATTKEPNGCNTLIQCLEVFKDVLGDKQTYDFCV